MAVNRVSTKWLPTLENELNYESWRKDVQIWARVTDVPKEKQALVVHLSLSGRARNVSSQIPVSDLESDDGLKVLLEKLDNLFLPDKGRRQFMAFNELYNMRRSPDMRVIDFVSEFEHLYFKFGVEGMTLPDSVVAYMLLASCKLNENDVHLVM